MPNGFEYQGQYPEMMQPTPAAPPPTTMPVPPPMGGFGGYTPPSISPLGGAGQTEVSSLIIAFYLIVVAVHALATITQYAVGLHVIGGAAVALYYYTYTYSTTA